MIAFIEGKVAGKNPGELVLCAGGVGFSLMCSSATLAAAPAQGESWRCYTVLNVREDAMELFGFATRQEREMFTRLCTVTGVGAKTALGVLSALPMRELSIAIVTGDVAALSRAPGIGKKTAQRIVLELKGKLTDVGITAEKAAQILDTFDEKQAAIDSLMGLGFSSADASDAVEAVSPLADTAEELVVLALKRLGM